MNYKAEIEGLKLSNLYDLCYAAHRNVSFYPEKRAVSTIQSYSEQLSSDLEKLGENKGNYEVKYIDYFRKWMNAKANTISSMITGPSNFPVNRAIKANNREQGAYEEFSKWRDRYFKEVNKVATKSPEDDLTDTENRLEKLIAFQDQVKEVNVFLRKNKNKSIENNIEMLVQEGYTKVILENIENRGGGYKIPGFVLTNNNATIKRLKERVQILGVRIERKENFEDLKFEGGYITISDDRVKVIHDEKPSADIISKLKRGGFRWSPFWKAWVRKHTGQALKDAIIIVGYQKPKVEIRSSVTTVSSSEDENTSDRTRNIRILKLKYKYQ